MNTIQNMLVALTQDGMTDGEISRRTGIPQPTVTRLRNGQHKDTSYVYGKRVEELFLNRHNERAA